MQATIIMHGWLRALAHPPFRGQAEIGYPLLRRASVKDVVESLGAPHRDRDTDCGGREVGFTHILAPGERLEVFPLVPPVDVTVPTLLRSTPYPRLRFLVDHNVAKLASKLRMAGLDAAFDPGWHDQELATLAHAGQRILLSRDVLLLKRGLVAHGHLVRESMPNRQSVEVVQRWTRPRSS